MVDPKPVLIGTLEFEGEQLQVYRSAYRRNDALAVFADTAHGEPYGAVSENHENLVLGPNEFAVQTRNLGRDFVLALESSGLFENTGRWVTFGQFRTREPIWRIKNGA